MKTAKLALAFILLFAAPACAEDFSQPMAKAVAYLSFQDSEGQFPMQICVKDKCQTDCSFAAGTWIINTLAEQPPITAAGVRQLLDKLKKYFPGKQSSDGLWPYAPSPLVAVCRRISMTPA